MGDYISREAAHSEACKGCSIDFPCDPCEPQNCEIKARLEAIPAADVVEVRHGQKIDITTAEDFLPWCKYSVCGYDGLFLEDEYCSRCGAKLDGGQKNV